MARILKRLAAPLVILALSSALVPAEAAGSSGDRSHRDARRPKKVTPRVHIATEYGDFTVGRLAVRVGDRQQPLPVGKAVAQTLEGGQAEITRTEQSDNEEILIRIGRPGRKNRNKPELELRLLGEPGTHDWTLHIAVLHHLGRFDKDSAIKRLTKGTLLGATHRASLADQIGAYLQRTEWSTGPAVASFGDGVLRYSRFLPVGRTLTFRYYDDAGADAIADLEPGEDNPNHTVTVGFKLKPLTKKR